MFRRILLAVDGTESSQVAASFAAAMARESGALVWVVHVNELLVGGRGFAAATDAEAQAVVDDAVGVLHECGIPADGGVQTAQCFDVAARIVDAAADFGADVVVLGSRRRRWFLRPLGSGMRDQVARLTPLPTMIAPAPLTLGRQHRKAADPILAGLEEQASSRTR